MIIFPMEAFHFHPGSDPSRSWGRRLASLQLPGLMADGFLWRRRQTSLLIRTKNLRGTDFLRRFTKNKPAFRVLAMIFLGSRCAHVELQSRMLLTIRNVIRANIQINWSGEVVTYISWIGSHFKTSISQLELSVWNAWKKSGWKVGFQGKRHEFWSKPADISSKPQPEGSAKCQNCNTTWIIIILDLWARSLRIAAQRFSLFRKRILGYIMFLGKNLIVACDSSCKIGSKNSIVPVEPHEAVAEVSRIGNV